MSEQTYTVDFYRKNEEVLKGTLTGLTITQVQAYCREYQQDAEVFQGNVQVAFVSWKGCCRMYF